MSESGLSPNSNCCLFRMLWAFSRDGGVPLYRVWGAINEHLHTPLNATWAMTTLAFLLGLPILFSTTAFLAIGSIMCVALYFSCESLPSPPFSPAHCTHLLQGPLDMFMYLYGTVCTLTVIPPLVTCSLATVVTGAAV